MAETGQEKRLSDGPDKGSNTAHNVYPDRPGEPDCSYYMRTGTCAYGSNCPYNHPTYIGQGSQYTGDLSQREGQQECQFFLKTGTCRYGSTCKYHHPCEKMKRPISQRLGRSFRMDVARGFMEFGFDSSSTIAASVDPLKRPSPSTGKEADAEKKAASKPPQLSKKRDRYAPEAAPAADPKSKKSKLTSNPATASKEKQVVVTPVASSEKQVVISPEPAISRGKSPDCHLEVRIPKEGRCGLIWKQGLPSQHPDSLGVYLPGYTKMLNPTEKPSGLEEFSREVFRATELPYMRQKMKEDPGAALSMVMGHIHELGSIVGYMKDDLASREGKLKVLEVSAAQVAKAVMERDYWRNHIVDYKAKFELTQRELTASNSDLEARTKEVKESSKLLKESSKSLGESYKRNLELSQALEALKAENKKLKVDNKKLKEDLAESSPQAIKYFLKSVGFKCAAQLAVLDTMRYTIYRELKKLGAFYPFVPEQLGYAPVVDKLAIPKDLSEYKWDEGKDIMIGPDGEPVPSRLKLETCDISGIVHSWDKESWPSDVRSLDTPVSEAGPSEQTGAS